MVKFHNYIARLSFSNGILHLPCCITLSCSICMTIIESHSSMMPVKPFSIYQSKPKRTGFTSVMLLLPLPKHNKMLCSWIVVPRYPPAPDNPSMFLLSSVLILNQVSGGLCPFHNCTFSYRIKSNNFFINSVPTRIHCTALLLVIFKYGIKKLMSNIGYLNWWNRGRRRITFSR